MILYGIGGTNGSGKDTIGQILAEEHGFMFVSVTDLLRDEARKRGLPVEREVLRKISAEWRRESGLGVLVDKAVDLYNQHLGEYKGLVLSSLRNPGENDRVHMLNGKVIWTDADPKVRYNRIYSRQRTAEDDKTFEQFIKEEQDEMTSTGDEATLRTADVKVKADIFINNDSSDLDDLKRELKKVLDL